MRVSIPWQFYGGNNHGNASKAAITGRRGEIAGFFKIPPNVFSTTELDQISELIKRGRVKLNVNLTVDVGGGKSPNKNVKVEDASIHPRAAIDAAIVELCAGNNCEAEIINMAGKP